MVFLLLLHLQPPGAEGWQQVGILLPFSQESFGSLSKTSWDQPSLCLEMGRSPPTSQHLLCLKNPRPCHHSAACWKIPTPFQHIKTPKSHEFPFSFHRECLCWEGESHRLRDSATAVAGEAEAAWPRSLRMLLKGP